MSKVGDDLKLSKYTLSAEEAHRFRAILGEAVSRLSLVGLVTDNSKKRLANKREPSAQKKPRNRKDLDSLMEKQKDLERQFERLMHKRWTLRGLSNKAKFEKNQKELAKLAKALRLSSSNINQNLKDHPTIVGNLSKLQKDRIQLEEMLRKTMLDLENCLFNTLVEKVATREKDQARLEESKKANQETLIALKSVEEKYESECERFDRETEERDAKISEITAFLKKKKKVTRLALNFEKETALARAETKARLRKRKLDELQRKIRRAKEDLARDAHVHELTTNFLTKKAKELNDADEKWVDLKKVKHKKIEDKHKKLQKDSRLQRRKLKFHRGRWDKHQSDQKALADEAVRRQKQEDARQRLRRVMGLAQCKVRFWLKFKDIQGKKKGKKKKKKKKKKKNKS